MPIDLDAIKERLKELNGDRPRRPATPEPYWRSGRSRELPFERRTDYRTGSLLAEYGEQKFDKNGKLLRRAINGWIIIGKTFCSSAISNQIRAGPSTAWAARIASSTCSGREAFQAGIPNASASLAKSGPRRCEEW